MFDIGFWEIAIIGVVALLVVGPERLPALARTTGLYVGRMRRFINQVKQDVESELHAQELKDLAKKPDGIDDVYEMLEETKGELEKAGNELNDNVEVGSESTNPDDTHEGSEDWTRELNAPTQDSAPESDTSSPPADSESDKSPNR